MTAPIRISALHESRDGPLFALSRSVLIDPDKIIATSEVFFGALCAVRVEIVGGTAFHVARVWDTGHIRPGSYYEERPRVISPISPCQKLPKEWIP